MSVPENVMEGEERKELPITVLSLDQLRIAKMITEPQTIGVAELANDSFHKVLDKDGKRHIVIAHTLELPSETLEALLPRMRRGYPHQSFVIKNEILYVSIPISIVDQACSNDETVKGSKELFGE